MKQWLRAALAVGCGMAAMVGMTSSLHAQTGSSRRTTPSAGTWAAGVDAGFANPLGDDDFDAEPTLDAYLEYFCTPHVSVRGMAAFIGFEADDVPGVGPVDLDLFSFNGNVLYQWEGGVVHPFVGGGLGIYNYDPDVGDGDAEIGFNGGGGVNFYLAERFAIKVEGQFHVTDGPEPDSYFAGTAGARWLWGGR